LHVAFGLQRLPGTEERRVADAALASAHAASPDTARPSPEWVAMPLGMRYGACEMV
jgi:hypothetical protein